RPISALVDITNYVTFDLGRPLHVFDAAKVKGNIVARMATNGEKFLALDGKEYELDDEICVIADDNGAEALGGVMGGEASGCTESTTSVFIESAIFNPIRTAATGRKLNIISDARFRFERSVDQAFAAPGIEIATRLVLEICGGEPSEITTAGAEPKWQRDIAFRPDRVKELIGVKVERDEMTRILSVLGFGVSGDGDEWTVAIPSWRADIIAEPCIVEEIIRVYGYDRIPAVSLPRDGALPKPALTVEQALRATIRRTLASRGMVEAVTYSFMPSGDADLFGGVVDGVRLVNPISSDLDVMRPSILPNLLAAIGRNDARGFGDGKLFEVGPQFSGDGSDDQELAASGVRSGTAVPRNWAEPTRKVDAFDAKSDAMAAIAAFGIDVGKAQITNSAPSWYHPGRSGSIQLGPQNVLAHFGEIHPAILKKMDIKGPIAGFEVYLSALPKPKHKKSQQRTMLRLSALQPVERDFAFVVDSSTPAADVRRAAAGADKKLISSARVFDLFEGK
ncbi:MAG: phenylalanine--tRNA ligase subunit beta, partial [Rhodospirillaceae bacterium]|nr:phenylalanine--tRNA ligase subunit beta [Rhodospirillaceae bacterium]